MRFTQDRVTGHRIGTPYFGPHVYQDAHTKEDITAIGGNPKWFDAEPRGEGIEKIRLIMKDGVIYKNTLEGTQ